MSLRLASVSKHRYMQNSLETYLDLDRVVYWHRGIILAGTSGLCILCKLIPAELRYEK